ncbi:MipA/OmpV family protein [Poseidonocella sp. HB161398]|uniref:MipA/OmpV family protein n=1 Tax=Poseidonocella sp. HB161398 TaxID=2320855 RepID=UPI00110899CA|nr:MipA/OmpV family protein [Poseidonocella sp. HB161398]
MRLPRIFRSALLLALSAGAAAAQVSDPAEPTLPLWELGLGAVGRVETSYPGADSYRLRGSPVPYVKYRGRFLELGGDEALRLIPLRTERFELGVSLDSSARVANRVTSLGNVVPDVDALAEFGPELIYRAAEPGRLAGGRLPGQLELLVQARGVFSVSDWSRIGYEGALLRPAIRYRQFGVLRPGSRIQAGLGPVFVSQGVQAEYYEVAPGPGQPGYEARGGYLGTEARVAIRYPLTGRLTLFGGLTASYLGGAVNRDSPLMNSDWDGGAYIGVTYSIFQSKRRTTRDR